MRNLALVLSAFGFIAFAGVARADQKTESTQKTDTSTTLSGKHKKTHVQKTERADGSSVETKTETTMPKDTDKRDDEAVRARHDDNNAETGADTKTTEHTTLSGKKEMKTTKKVDNPDGSHTETTTTKTEPKR